MCESYEPVANMRKPHVVGIMHRASAVDRESVAVVPDHVDVAGPSGNALTQDAGALVDHREQQALHDLILADGPTRDTALLLRLGGHPLYLKNRLRSAGA